MAIFIIMGSVRLALVVIVRTLSFWTLHRDGLDKGPEFLIHPIICSCIMIQADVFLD